MTGPPDARSAWIQAHSTIAVATRGPRLHAITREAQAAVEASGVDSGSCQLLVLHTSASLLIQENADPAVQRDLQAFFARLVPEGGALYEHDAEGPDDMPAHLKAALTPVSLAVPVSGGQLRLGRWQGIYLWEHRRGAHERRIAVHVFGEQGRHRAP